MSAVVEQFTDANGRVQRPPADTVSWIRRHLSDDAERTAGPIVVNEGDRWRFGPGVLRLESGEMMTISTNPTDEIPIGYHTFVADEAERVVVVAPARCPSPATREWGWATQLYATRSESSWGIGDLGDLRHIADWADDGGARFVLVNPLNANAPGPDQQPSPYSPTSRRFLNPIYLDARPFVREASQQSGSSDLAERAAALNAVRTIDRDRVLALKMEVMESVFAGQQPHVDLTSVAQSLREFATWTALAEQFGGDWRTWPSEYRHPRSRSVADYAEGHADCVRFHIWMQQLLHQQLADVCARTRLVQDLPIGFDPGGMDAWAWQDLLALDASVGAPPDEFSTQGQDWGLPPFIPDQLRGAGFSPFIETVRARLAVDGGLRIDHVMGLFRLWWIPDGAGAAQGAFVRYPADDMLSILALESHRANAVVIGEDLGTVEPEALTKLADRNVLSYKLLWFEKDHPSQWKTNALAAVSTHDLPTVAGLWDHSDLQTQTDLGLEPNVPATLEIRDRLAEQGELDAETSTDDAVRAAYALLAEAPSQLIVASLDDAVGEPERPNIPGADDQRPNWSIPLPLTLEQIESHPLARDIAATMNRAVQGSPATPN